MGGGRGTESAPSSPSSSPQLCMPDELDLDSVPLDRPSLRTLCRTTAGVLKLVSKFRGLVCAASHLLEHFILRSGSAVVRVSLGAHGYLPALPHVVALLVLVGELLHVAVCFAAAQPAHWAGEPLSKGITWK